MSIRDWPAGERPREKLLLGGAGSLSDAELLAIFLRTGTPGRSAVDMARDLLTEFGGLRQILEASHSDFCRANGLGDAKYAQLQAVIEMASRHMEQGLQRDEAFESPEVTRRYLSSRLRHYQHEVFAVMFLDNRHRLLCYEEMFRGSIDAAPVFPREIAKQALHKNAAAVILAHNHPSGVAEPSAADVSITHVIRDALKLLDIRVLDHFVIGDNTVSLAERGYL